MLDSISIIAPAKINLTLHITGKQPNGYHTLKTIMQSISLADIVTVKINNNQTINVTCTEANIPCDNRNIAYKSAQTFFSETNLPICGIDIHIEKHIPSEAGLGGGSADGAAVIIALNKLLQANLSIERLCQIGCKVGADIPFCITGGTKLCCGIGEIITDAPTLPQCYIVIGKGEQGISTKAAFSKIDNIQNLDNYDFNINTFSDSIEVIAENCSNIFEMVSDNNEITAIKKIMLDNNALNSVMSGSGSAVYGIFTNDSNAEQCCLNLAQKGFFTSLSHPVNHGCKKIDIS